MTAIEYLDRLEQIVRDGQSDTLKKLLDARIRQSPEAIEGLVSPPLGRDEPDANLLLYYLYQRLSNPEDEESCNHLRYAVVDLYWDAAASEYLPDIAYAGSLARLIGSFHVASHPKLANPLRRLLLDMMRGCYDWPPIDTMMNGQVEEEKMRWAIHTIDLLLAITPPLCPDLDKEIEYFKGLFTACYHKINDSKILSRPKEEHFLLLLYSFRLLLYLSPDRPVPLSKFEQNTSALRAIYLFTEKVNRKDFSHHWSALCSILGKILSLDAYQEWRNKIITGLKRDPELKTAYYQKMLGLLGIGADELGSTDDQPATPFTVPRGITGTLLMCGPKLKTDYYQNMLEPLSMNADELCSTDDQPATPFTIPPGITGTFSCRVAA